MVAFPGYGCCEDILDIHKMSAMCILGSEAASREMRALACSVADTRNANKGAPMTESPMFGSLIENYCMIGD